MSNAVEQVRGLGQSIWYDNIRRGLIESGELQRLIDTGVSGLTSNPTIFEKAIAGSADYDDALADLARQGKSATEIFEALTMEDIRAVADLLRPTYDATGGGDGYASLEVSPHLARDTRGTVQEAERLFAALERPNVLIKIPATPEGIPAVREVIGRGINVNITLIFSLDAYERVREAYIAGLEDLARSAGDVSKIASVASFFVSRVDTAVDSLLQERIAEGQDELGELLGKMAVANAKVAYQAFKTTFGGQRFAALGAKGARVQRPLWASTGTKNAAYSDVHYIEPLIGPDTVNTMPQATLTAFLEHGAAAETVEQGAGAAQEALGSLAGAGISMEEVTDRLLVDGVKSFADSYDQLLANIEEKTAQLQAQEHLHRGVSLGDGLPSVEVALEELRRDDVVARIWRGDHTVWKPEPEDITDRLGWLKVTDVMREQVPALRDFANEIRTSGFHDVVLLGMGGSSLGPEVLRQTFGSASGFPQLTVLDSTVPSWVNAVTEAIDPSRTLFLVSSKSGGTAEPMSLYAHFNDVVARELGPEKAGENFAAITDPGSSLEGVAREAGFRRAFLNPPDLGGRYSVLSYFGLVPAALIGADVEALLDRADSMRESCASSVPPQDNPGAWLGAVMGTLASRGRDKLTLVTSPSIESLGLWVEQLIAESTGKDGRGIVPVAGEPLLSPEHYGDDRLFVYVRVVEDDNAGTDEAVQRLESAGQPVVRLELRDRYGLGAEFYRWEFAIAVAGALLGVHPFDQPNVEQAKELTAEVLREYRTTGRMPEAAATGSPEELLSGARAGDYLSIMAYVRQRAEMDRALAGLRRRVMERYRIATTLGYGPRFLHSTGQLHKGGPDSGLFLQITAQSHEDVPVPGEAYSFGVLAKAQAQGDLRALQERGWRVASVRMDSDEAEGIARLLS